MNKDVLEYRGFKGSIEYSEEDGVWHGKILDIKDLVTYEADSCGAGLTCAFIDTVDDYVLIEAMLNVY